MSGDNEPSTDIQSATGTDDAVNALDDDSELNVDELAERKTALKDVIEMLRPMVQMDGGDLEVIEVDYDNGVVEVQLQGACGSCAVSSATLSGGVERILKERLSWVTEVIGGVDEEIDDLESASLGRGAYVPKYY